MRNYINKIWTWTALLALLSLGCHFQQKQVPEETTSFPKIKKMVVAGFLPVMSQSEKPDVIRSSLSGAVIMAEPVPQDVANKMTDDLFERLLKDKDYDLISPAQTRGVFLSLVSSELVSNDIEIYKKVGRAFSADTVLMGYIYRWREREGTAYAVNRPASVAFDLYLIRSDDGAILWKGKFDKAQRSLSENILDMDTFLKGGGKWMNAEELAGLGLEDLLIKLLKK